MKSSKSTLCALLALSGLAVSTLHAHRSWVIPSSTVVSGEDQWITVDAAVSNDLFFANYRPLSPEGFRVVGPTGEDVPLHQPQVGKLRGVFDVHLTAQGTYKIVSERTGYFAQWTEDGERQRSRGDLETFRRDGVLAKAGVELRRTVSRLEAAVTLGAPTETVFAPSGEGIEWVPVTHPNDLFVGEPVEWRFLVDGKPAEGLELTVIRGDDRYRDVPENVELTTDAEGLATITFATPGRYWLNASARGEGAAVEGIPVATQYGFTATVEVLPE